MSPAIRDLLRYKAVYPTVTPLFRIIDKAYEATPLGMGFGSSRFSSPTNSFKVLYSAPELHTCVMEAILRDCMENEYPRAIEIDKLLTYSVAEIATTKRPRTIPLTKDVCYKYSQSTDIVGGKDHSASQKLSEELYEEPTLDGLTFRSRFSDHAMCQMNYDRSVPQTLRCVATTLLVDIPGVDAIFRDLNVQIVASIP